ncbi:MAG: YggS family pyridoxal phosphate-dependent enzyme [Clostridia bacterium]|nr:YggS family pyridoxal phosphate-dependent enzyme [Clostridia bacterium]
MAVDVKANLDLVKERIAQAAAKSGRDPQEVRIVAVTKNVPLDVVRQAIEAGVRIVGENRVQEAMTKFPYLDSCVERHFIGHLQRNKVRAVVQAVNLIHSLDSLRLAEEINKWGERLGRPVEVLIQVNVSGEASKYGVSPDALEAFTEKVAQLAYIRVRGLMTIAPEFKNAEDARPVFRKLSQLALEIGKRNLPGVEVQFLSMGMTNDYWVAVEEGANLVRIGRALFGERGR